MSKEEFSSPNEVLNYIWKMLQRGVKDARDDYHTSVIGTVDEIGPNLRTVVLRKVIVQERKLICHTDVRSTKVDQLQNDPNMSWIFYHDKEKMQLRMRGKAFVHIMDKLAVERWGSVRLISRRCYLTEPGPGTYTEFPVSGIPKDLKNRRPSKEESEVGRKNFAVIDCRIDHIDWLYLRSSGNLRAEFKWDEKNRLSSGWLIP